MKEEDREVCQTRHSSGPDGKNLSLARLSFWFRTFIVFLEDAYEILLHWPEIQKERKCWIWRDTNSGHLSFISVSILISCFVVGNGMIFFQMLKLSLDSMRFEIALECFISNHTFALASFLALWCDHGVWSMKHCKLTVRRSLPYKRIRALN